MTFRSGLNIKCIKLAKFPEKKQDEKTIRIFSLKICEYFHFFKQFNRTFAH